MIFSLQKLMTLLHISSPVGVLLKKAILKSFEKIHSKTPLLKEIPTNASFSCLFMKLSKQVFYRVLCMDISGTSMANNQTKNMNDLLI